MKRITFCVGLWLGGAFCALAIPSPILPTITAIPSNGTVGGPPGTVVGWGVNVTFNDPSNWVVLNDSNFTGAPTYGTYHDYLPTEFIVAGPTPESSSVTVPFVPGSTGLGEFDINPTAPPGAPIGGNINVDYTIFSQDPNDPSFDPGSFVSSGTVPVSVTVLVTPEPASWGLVLMFALPFVVFQRFRSRLS